MTANKNSNTNNLANIQLTPFDLAYTHLGLKEVTGSEDHPLIVWWLSLCGLSKFHDETPWCSAFVNGVCWLLQDFEVPRSKSAAARSWLKVGLPVQLNLAVKGWDIVILKRGGDNQPGPEVINAPGHVGFYVGVAPDGRIQILGGNQSNAVTIQPFDASRVLGVRRLFPGQFKQRSLGVSNL